MEIFNIRKGRTYKSVTFINVPSDADPDALLDAACKATGETWRGESRSLFGWQVKRVGNVVTADLWTD